MASIVVISFRLGGLDGVSIESAKWIKALGQLGHEVTTLAGAGRADHLLPELAMNAAGSVDLATLRRLLDGVDLVIVENIASLPINRAARDALYDLLSDRAALFHHHDFSWQQAHWSHLPAPLDNPRWAHVVINQRSVEELAQRGMRADLLRNRFDCSPPTGDRAATRAVMAVGEHGLVLMPSRAIARKNVAGAVTLARDLGASLWLLGPAEVGYETELDLLIADSGVRVLRGLPPTLSIHDAYAASDCVVVPSTWEGFGNPVLESVTHRRPLALNHYPVAQELLDFGFVFYELSDLAGLRAAMAVANEEERAHNLAIARQHFNIDDLPAELEALLTRHFGWAKR